MEYDSASSCEGRLKDLEAAEELPRTIVEKNQAEREAPTRPASQWITTDSVVARTHPFVVTERSLSAQVMEYYHKYSQNSSLGHYFSLPESGIASDGANYYQRMCESIPETGANREQYVILASEERSRIDSSTPRERRRWARPPLIGQPSTSEGAVASTYVGATSTDSRTPSPICKRPITETIPEERNESSRENLGQVKDSEGKASSPTSSVASHKPLEWDSGADVGYYNALPLSKEKDKKLCTIERMALARGCSAALRLDPEGTNESTGSVSHATGSRINARHSMKPDANSTPLAGIRHQDSGESEGEIEITPIVKNHAPGIITGCEEMGNKGACSGDDQQKKSKGNSRLLESSEVPTKCSAEESEKFKDSRKESKEERESSPLKKSSSMNLLVFPLSRLSLKRSQSELNLRVKEKKSAQPLPPLIFNSTSSIATVVNKPSTCDKFIQTSLDTCSRESIGIQVSVTETSDDSSNEALHNIKEARKSEEEEEKPPLPKRASSLAPKSLHSILKNSCNTYNVRDRSGDRHGGLGNGNRKVIDVAERGHKAEDSVDGVVEVSTKATDRNTRGSGRTDSSSGSNSSASNGLKNESSSVKSVQAPLEEDTTGENAAGRASNSFEYVPGHVYQNVRNGSTSNVSSIDTGRESRCSTMPNTSSSIDEKLWGNSDSLVRDLERSVNILKSLVDANKCDKQVKKRLIHHVIKRLVTAKYTDDRIERDLEENVPWNPADARNKVYRNEIIQALANKHNTTDSSADDWRPRKRNTARGSSASPKKTMTSKEARVAKEIIELVATSAPSTPNTDEFPFDRLTDRTVMDGRKARMGLRCEDRRRENANTDQERSESSECFLPQSHIAKKPVYTLKSTNLFYTINDDKSNEKSRPTPSPPVPGAPVVAPVPITTNTSNSSKNTACHRNLGNDGIVLAKEHRRTQSNETDWRLPTTMSERRFEMGRCSNSESGDTKLINYAEMEKRNQLVWITNEISHLCNLKRLLQEPNTFDGRERGPNSPRKRHEQWAVRTRSSSRSRNERSRGSDSETGHDDKRVPRDELVSKNFENLGQWSSHGNLTGGRSATEYQRTTSRNRGDDRTDIRSVRHTRKLRNSCTQTGSDGGPSGHSNTGGEIISSTIPVLASAASTRVDRTATSRICDASVQTIPQSPKKLANSVSTEPEHSSTCPTRVRSNAEEKTAQKHVCYCQRYAAHSRHSACIVDSAKRCARDHAKHCPYRARDERPLIITTNPQAVPNPQTVATNSKSNDSRKEAKNQLNANCKSKYAIRELPTKAKARCAECELHEKILSEARIMQERETAAASGSNDRKKHEILKTCLCPIECNCEVGRCQRNGDDSINEKHTKENAQRTPYCETSSDPEESVCRHLKNFAQSPACSRCKHDTDELPLASGSETERRKQLPSSSADSNVTKNIRKSCRTCGTIWPVRDGKNVNRKCSCTQDYLKPVAYELNFDDMSEVKVKNDGGMKIDKIGTKVLPTTETDQTKATKSPPNSNRSRGKCASDKDDEKEHLDNNGDKDHRPSTLKDFLATNKPQFLENVETRRQYMSEISQLRQLKKEKRKQFLAMTGDSVFLKPQKPAKGSTTNAQRKISEYDMKLKLRMRYLRLNEVRNKRRQREKEEDARRNHLMAKLFGQKLQEKVLRGQVDLSQSVSVISNL